MSLTGEQTPIEPPEGENLSSLFEELEQARDEFFTVVTDYFRVPSSSKSDLLAEQADKVTLSIYKFASCVINDDLTDVTQKSEILSTAVFEDEENRVKFFNGLCGNVNAGPFKVAPFAKESLAEFCEVNIQKIEAEESTTDELVAKIAGGYNQSMNVDINKLIELCSSTPRGKLLQVCESLGRHSVDLLKISAGVAIGSVIAKEWDRFRS